MLYAAFENLHTLLGLLLPSMFIRPRLPYIPIKRNWIVVVVDCINVRSTKQSQNGAPFDAKSEIYAVFGRSFCNFSQHILNQRDIRTHQNGIFVCSRSTVATPSQILLANWQLERKHFVLIFQDLLSRYSCLKWHSVRLAKRFGEWTRQCAYVLRFAKNFRKDLTYCWCYIHMCMVAHSKLSFSGSRVHFGEAVGRWKDVRTMHHQAGINGSYSIMMMMMMRGIGELVSAHSELQSNAIWPLVSATYSHDSHSKTHSHSPSFPLCIYLIALFDCIPAFECGQMGRFFLLRRLNELGRHFLRLVIAEYDRQLLPNRRNTIWWR